MKTKILLLEDEKLKQERDSHYDQVSHSNSIKYPNMVNHNFRDSFGNMKKEAVHRNNDL